MSLDAIKLDELLQLVLPPFLLDHRVLLEHLLLEALQVLASVIDHLPDTLNFYAHNLREGGSHYGVLGAFAILEALGLPEHTSIIQDRDVEGVSVVLNVLLVHTGQMHCPFQKEKYFRGLLPKPIDIVPAGVLADCTATQQIVYLFFSELR